jgi:hypothetical protein
MAPPAGPSRVSAAFGLYGNKQAFAIGYGRQVRRGAANFGLARSGKKTMGGGSFGLSW